MSVWFRLCVDLDFVAVLSDTAIDNLQAIFASVGNGMTAVGTLPDAMYARHSEDRSTDVVVVYMSLQGTKSLRDWIASADKPSGAEMERFTVLKPVR